MCLRSRRTLTHRDGTDIIRSFAGHQYPSRTSTLRIMGAPSTEHSISLPVHMPCFRGHLGALNRCSILALCCGRRRARGRGWGTGGRNALDSVWCPCLAVPGNENERAGYSIEAHPGRGAAYGDPDFWAREAASKDLVRSVCGQIAPAAFSALARYQNTIVRMCPQQQTLTAVSRRGGPHRMLRR
ncbi:hypothetical protein BD413DRAFT_101627 [Trametes elegans]|nr:hypothetical protein BD413DRAFT_101627 [Trametes elegans]